MSRQVPTLTLGEQALFVQNGAGLRENIRYRAPSAWGTSASLWKSALQKAIRRANVSDAIDAAIMLSYVPEERAQSNAMNRLRTIAVEDVGIATPAVLCVVDRHLEAAKAAVEIVFREPVRSSRHDSALWQYRFHLLGATLALTMAPLKTRLLSHAINAMAKVPSSKWIRDHCTEKLGLASEKPPGELKTLLESKSLFAVDAVYKYYELRKKAAQKFPAKEAKKVFELCRLVIAADITRTKPQEWCPLERAVDILKEWFAHGYSENELTVYTAVLLAVFRDKVPTGVTDPDWTMQATKGFYRDMAKQTGAPPVADYAIDMHTAQGKRLGRGKEHFAVEGTVVIPEWTIPNALGVQARKLKKCYEEFKLYQEAEAGRDKRPRTKQPSSTTTSTTTTTASDKIDAATLEWKSELRNVSVPMDELIVGVATDAHLSKKKAKPRLAKLRGISRTVFIKGPYDRKPWLTQAFIDCVKPSFGLNAVGMFRLIDSKGMLYLVMNDLNHGEPKRTVTAMHFKTEDATPKQDQLARILLFRAAWGISDTSANNLMFDTTGQKWYSIDESEMFQSGAGKRLLDEFRVCSKPNIALRFLRAYLKEHRAEMLAMLERWKDVEITCANAPSGATEKMRKNVRLMIDRYDSLHCDANQAPRQ